MSVETRIVVSPLQLAGSPTTPRTGPTEHDRLVARNAKLRRRNRDLTTQLALAAAQIQHLTLRNERLQEALVAASNVTSISGKPRLH